MLVLGNAIRYNNLVQWRSIDPIDGISAENTVGEKCVDFGRALFLQKLRGSGDCVGSIGQVIDENGYPVCNISYEHHGGILPVCDSGRSAFLGV